MGQLFGLTKAELTHILSRHTEEFHPHIRIGVRDVVGVLVRCRNRIIAHHHIWQKRFKSAWPLFYAKITWEHIVKCSMLVLHVYYFAVVIVLDFAPMHTTIFLFHWSCFDQLGQGDKQTLSCDWPTHDSMAFITLQNRQGSIYNPLKHAITYYTLLIRLKVILGSMKAPVN